MATKADILVRAIIADAKKKLAELTGSLRSVAAEEKVLSVAAADLTKASKSQLETLHNVVMAQIQQGTSLQELADVMGLTTTQVQQLAFNIEELTGKVKDQGIELLRTPKYIMGYRGGWLNLIATLGFGVSVFKVLHSVVAEFTDAIVEAAKADYHLMRQVEAATSVWDAYTKGIGEGVLELSRINIAGEEAALRLSRFHMIIEAIGRVIEETGIPVLREYGVMLKNIGEALGDVGEKAGEMSRQSERLIQAYQELIEQRADEAFDAQKQAIFDASGSAAEYTQRLTLLLLVSGRLAEVLAELGFAAFAQGAAFDYAARQAEKLRERFERIMGIVGLMADLQEEAGQYTRDLADAHDSFADRAGDALFRAEQAWESFTFRMAQALAAFNFRMAQMTARLQFRLGQMEARFQQRTGSQAARGGASAAAAAARFALKIESIKQDHYDKLEDMARDHQEELRRTLQRAPWYLQRAIREYQRRRRELEARGDKEGLARLKANFIERIRAIDPIFAEELEHLEELQQDERDVEEREFNQRLHRARAQYAISRALAASQAATTLADAEFAYGQQTEAAEFAYQQQKDAAEFAYQQRLDAMIFAYGQQKEASDRAYAQGLKDYEASLEDINRTFGQFMSEFQRDVYREWFNAGYQATRGWYGGFGWPAPPPPTPSPPEPRWPRKQTGMPYVPSTMPVVVHTGEAILRKDQAGAWREGGGEIVINFYGPVSMHSRQAVRQLATDISRELGRRAYVRR